MSVTSELIDIVNQALRNRWPGTGAPPVQPFIPGLTGATPAVPVTRPTVGPGLLRQPAPPAMGLRSPPVVQGPGPGMFASPPAGTVQPFVPGLSGATPAVPVSPPVVTPGLLRQPTPPATPQVTMPPMERSLRQRLTEAGAGAAGVGAVAAAVNSERAAENAPNIVEVAPAAAPPAAPQTAPANAQAPTTQDRYRQELERRAFGGGGGGGFRPREITPDMMPNWQLVRDANAAARPEAPEQMSDEDMRRNVLLAFLGSFEQRPGERLGAAFARQGGAAGRARTGAEEQNRQTRDVTRREQQAYRQGQAALEAQIQTGQSRSLIDMIRANNEAQLQAAQLAAAGSGRSLQALLALSQMDDPTRRVSPDYATSRVVQAALDSRNPMPIPGLDIAAARQAALNSQEWLNLPQTERGLTNLSGQPNPALQALMARQLRAQIDALTTEQRAALLQSFRPLFTTRPPASARVGE